jgi:prolyl oligopeptidase
MSEGKSGRQSPPIPSPDHDTITPGRYPVSRRGADTRSVGGLTFEDPYYWLEAETPEVRAWQRDQARLAGEHVEKWAHFDRLRQVVDRFAVERRVSLPRFAGQCWFSSRIPPGASHAAVFVADDLRDEGRLLFDPAMHDPSGATVISWMSPSPDGAVLALGLCSDGSEKNHIALVDADSGRLLEGAPTATLMDNWTGGVSWLPDSSGFFFSALPDASVGFDLEVYYYDRRSAGGTQHQAIPWTCDRSYRMVTVARDGRHALAYERLDNPIPVAIAALEEGMFSWRPFIRSHPGIVAGPIIGDRLIAVTDQGADRGRLVAIDLDEAFPDDPSNWRELVGESDAVMRGVQRIADRLYVTEFVDSYARVRILDRHGVHIGEVDIPGSGAISELPFPIMSLIPFGHPDIFLFGFSTLLNSWSILAHDPATGQLGRVSEADVSLDDAMVEDHWATSRDGTRILYHIVRPASLEPVPHPALVYGYGAFNLPLLPQFPGPAAAIVAAGGLFVHAHLRGGGEFGKSWWEGGRLRNKQNGYDDLYAVAEDLIAKGRTAPDMLAVTGASNGGLMAAVAALQRPDLWRAAVPRVPLLDLIGACWNDYDRMCIQNEYADLRDPQDIRRLTTFSPYHLVREDTAYPAIYLDAGDTDPRCPAWHARKLAARLQAARGKLPVLLRVWNGVGHGWATDRSIAVRQATGWLAFVMRELGLGDRL